MECRSPSRHPVPTSGMMKPAMFSQLDCADGSVPGLRVMDPVGWPVLAAITVDSPHAEAGTKEPIGS